MTAIKALGAPLTPMTAGEISRYLRDSTASLRLLLNHNLHSLYLFHKDPWFRRLYAEADRVIVDGWPILRAASLVGHHQLSTSYRVGSTDWIAELTKDVAKSGQPFRIWILGTDATTNATARAVLESKAAGSIVTGGRDGFFDIHDCAEVLHQIEKFQPDLVLVGMGMPRQEEFLARNLSSLPPATYATVGGAIDYVAGKHRLAPRVLGRVGLEWAWRLANDPKRLAHRYLVEPLKLIRIVGRNRLLREGPWGTDA